MIILLAESRVLQISLFPSLIQRALAHESLVAWPVFVFRILLSAFICNGNKALNDDEYE